MLDEKDDLVEKLQNAENQEEVREKIAGLNDKLDEKEALVERLQESVFQKDYRYISLEFWPYSKVQYFPVD